MKNERKGKLEPLFETTEYQVINTARAESGQTFKRNGTMFKKVQVRAEVEVESHADMSQTIITNSTDTSV